MHQEYNYNQGLRSGIAKEFYPKETSPNPQQISRLLNYVDGKLQGEQKSFYRNSQKEAILTYDHGILHGLKALWNMEGVLIEEAHYKHGNLEGPYQTRKPNGMMVFFNYKDNRLDGLHQVFYPTKDFTKKVKALEATYVKGLLEGELSEYNEEGNKISNTHYLHGLRTGMSTLYFNDGKTKLTMTYKNDLLEGPRKEYFPNGKIHRIENYSQNKKEGEEVSYHENGKLASRGWYKDGKKEGLFQQWNSDSILVFEAEYKNDLRHGKFNKYDSQGKARCLQIYTEDKLSEKKKAIH